jgi:hypothetical protein
MVKERPLDLTVLRTWIGAWKEKDLYSDAAVRHLHSLIPNSNCTVVITFGVGRAPRSLVFSCRRFVAVTPQSRTQILAPRVAAECDIDNIAASSVAPMTPNDGQLWRRTDISPQEVLQWEGARWVPYGHVREVAAISKQGEKECGFMEALASAHRLARRNGSEVIYTFDDSTWGKA